MTKPAAWGRVRFHELPDGQVQADAYYRDELGRRKRYRARGASEDIALELLHAKAATGTVEALSASSTISELARYWLEDLEAHGDVRPQSLSSYRECVDRHIIPVLGGVRLAELTTPIVGAALRAKLTEGRSWQANRMRTLLMQMVSLAAQQGVIQGNPVRETKRAKIKRTPVQALSPEQVAGAQRAWKSWLHEKNSGGGRPTHDIWPIIAVILGTSMRIGEVLALRAQDLDFGADPHRVHVNGTLVEKTGIPLHRQDYLKHEGQERTLPLPAFAAATLKAAVSLDRGEDTPVFANTRGGWKSPHNIRRTIRAFRKDAEAELTLLGIDSQHLTPHAFRRAVATGIARSELGVEAAMRALGHGSLAVTEAYYIQRQSDVESAVADTLQELYGGDGGA